MIAIRWLGRTFQIPRTGGPRFVTAEGVLRSCLFEGGEVAIRSIIRSTAGAGATQRRDAIAHAMSECVRLKPDVHSHRGNRQMSQIGG